jgi:hypothetical protein
MVSQDGRDGRGRPESTRPRGVVIVGAVHGEDDDDPARWSADRRTAGERERPPGRRFPDGARTTRLSGYDDRPDGDPTS